MPPRTQADRKRDAYASVFANSVAGIMNDHESHVHFMRQEQGRLQGLYTKNTNRMRLGNLISNLALEGEWPDVPPGPALDGFLERHTGGSAERLQDNRRHAVAYNHFGDRIDEQEELLPGKITPRVVKVAENYRARPKPWAFSVVDALDDLRLG